MNEETPLGSEYNKPMAVVLKGPTAELYLYLTTVPSSSYNGVSTLRNNIHMGVLSNNPSNALIYVKTALFTLLYSCDQGKDEGTNTSEGVTSVNGLYPGGCCRRLRP
jgi:hypothetical protein